MTVTTEELKSHLCQLPLDDRAELASFLLASLTPFDDADVEAAWDAELARREADIRNGKGSEEPAESVFARLRSRYA
jgi:putative addiction module component (TIGR02574 family)